MPPRFRQDQLGSLIRPQSLLAICPRPAMLSDVRSPEISAVINDAIRTVCQEQLDLYIRPLVTGEYERSTFCNGMFEHLQGMQVFTDLRISEDFRHGLRNIQGAKSLGATTWTGAVATGKIKHVQSSYLPTWEVMKQCVPMAQWKDCKMSFITPTWQHVQLAKGTAYTSAAYSEDKDYFDDLTAAYRQEFLILYDAGLRNIQIDDPFLTWFILDDFRDGLRRSGVDPDALLDMYIDVHNQTIAGLPEDMTTGLHLCRGNMPKNFPRYENFIGSGSYERIAKPLFTRLRHNTLYLEYDDARSGSFEPLRHIQMGTNVVLGLVSTKSPDLEDPEVLKSRVNEAAEVIAQGQGRNAMDVLQDTLAVSPQCGFSTSTVLRGVGTQEMMWRKLVLVRDLARNIWADAI